MASISKLACIYSALILHEDEVTATEDKIKGVIKAAGVNVEPFCSGLFAKALANVNIGSLICNVRTGGPAPPAAGAAPAGAPTPSTAAAPDEEKKAEAKKEESEESEEMGTEGPNGLSDVASPDGDVASPDGSAAPVDASGVVRASRRRILDYPGSIVTSATPRNNAQPTSLHKPHQSSERPDNTKKKVAPRE
ncbi:60S acidic ribosomal protein P1-like [Trachypithecus francoisi]|uniref:60S acidic ribosomal protein P1-like n=1 Tax=Trachypithecus francoisi TaxID=54180 RepID=UPI00141BB605|nr:60S acidic ribosomal protein P1-like [Trachypithecus francoisi]